MAGQYMITGAKFKEQNRTEPNKNTVFSENICFFTNYL